MKKELKCFFYILLYFLFITNLFAEQRIFLSANLNGDNLRKELIKWVKNNSLDESNYKILDNGFIYLFYVSDINKKNNILCFDITFNLQHDKFIVDFSNAKLFNKSKNEIKDLKFTSWDKLTNSGWFKKYNEEIGNIVEELEEIIR